MKIIDNFLPDYQFKQLQSLMLGPGFNWYYCDGASYPGDEFYQFVHFFYRDTPYEPTPSFSQVEPCLSFFNMKKIYRIKANLRPKTIFHRKSSYHIDDLPCSTTAILYMNTNNGWTQFKKGDKVESVENRVVIFDSKLEHGSVTCTDEKRRIVLNFNYDL